MLPEIIGSTARTVLASVAGYLVSQGWLDPTNKETLIGIGIGLITLGWSIWQKKRAKSV